MEQINELAVFLSQKASLPLKSTAIEYVLGLSSSDEGAALLKINPKVLEGVVSLLSDNDVTVANNAYKTLVNLTGYQFDQLSAVLDRDDEWMRHALKNMMDKESPTADGACMLLTNLTRIERYSREFLRVINKEQIQIGQMVEIMCQDAYNPHCSLEHLSHLLANLTQLSEVRKSILDETRCIIQRLLPYTRYEKSDNKRRGVVTLLKNCCFESAYHAWLLGPQVDILPYLLLPLAGPEELSEEDMEGMPDDLQYLEDDKKREPLPDIRNMLMESVMQLCSTTKCRQCVKEKKAYIIMREYHKWEKVAGLIETCEKLVSLLISDEPEENVGNLKEINIPHNVLKSLESSEISDNKE